MTIKRQSFLIVIFFLLIFSVSFKKAIGQASETRKEVSPPDLVSALLQLEVPDVSLSEKHRDPDQPPTADTEDEDRLFYWVRRTHDEEGDKLTRSAEEEKRIFQALLKDPSLLPNLLVLFPADADHAGMVKSLYDRFMNDPDLGEEWRAKIRIWLRRNSSFFRDELIRFAESEDEGEEDLVVLAQLDWEVAKPIVQRLSRSGTQVKAVVANRILFENSLKVGNKNEIAALRNKLIGMAFNWQVLVESRVEALTALLDNPWSGRDAWFLSILCNPTLRIFKNKNRSLVIDYPISHAIWKNQSHWIPLLVGQVGQANRNIHDMATRILASLSPSPEAFRPLLPCLKDPTWCLEETRKKFIQELRKVDIPESIPGLIWVIENDPDEDCREDAAYALVRYKDLRAVPALRKILPKAVESLPFNGEGVIAAIIACNGFSAEEYVAFLEAWAIRISKEESPQDDEYKPENPKEYSSLIAEYLIRHKMELSEDVFSRVIIRIKQLVAYGDKHKAEKLEEVLYHWQGKEIDRYVGEQVLGATASIATLTKALEDKERIAATHESGLRGLAQKGGPYAGIAMAILLDQAGMMNVLQGADAEAKKALLGCLRCLRAPVPLSLVSGLFDNADPKLVNAAELYLQALDNLEARSLLLERSRESFAIVGRFPGYDAGHHSNESFKELEEKLVEEMKGNPELDEIIALLSAGYWGDAGQRIIRIRGGRAVFSVHKDPAFVLERQLEDRQLKEVQSFLESNQADGPKPLLNSGVHDGMQYEYLHMKKSGGIRVVMNNPGLGHSSPQGVYEKLALQFFTLEQSGPMRANFTIKEQRPDLEVLFIGSGDKSVQTICRVGKDIRILTGRGDIENWSWSSLQADGGLTPTEQPVDCETLAWGGKHISARLSSSYTDLWRFPWQVHYKNGMVMSGMNQSGIDGLWHCLPDLKPSMIVSGRFSHQLVSLDQKWLVALCDGNLVRVNLLSKEVIPIRFKTLEGTVPVAFIPSVKKFLLITKDKKEYSEVEDNLCYLLDPASGEYTRGIGDFSPWLGLYFRFFQAAEKPDLVWVAKPKVNENLTEVGIFDTRHFTFTCLTRIPQLLFDSMRMWVDRPENKLYVVYNGHLLRFSL